MSTHEIVTGSRFLLMILRMQSFDCADHICSVDLTHRIALMHHTKLSGCFFMAHKDFLHPFCRSFNVLLVMLRLLFFVLLCWSHIITHIGCKSIVSILYLLLVDRFMPTTKSCMSLSARLAQFSLGHSNWNILVNLIS